MPSLSAPTTAFKAPIAAIGSVSSRHDRRRIAITPTTASTTITTGPR
jgi:hypothetical protein